MTTTSQQPHVLAGVTVGDVMGAGFVTCFPGDDLATVASKLATDGVHVAVLTPLNHGAPRIVTDVDIIRAALSGTGRELAADINRDPAVSLVADAPVTDAIAEMAEKRTRRLVVVDPGTGVPIGLVSGLDLIAPLGEIHHRLPGVPGSSTFKSPPGVTTLGETKVAEVVRRNILTCDASVPLSVLARNMAEHHVHCMAIAGIEHPGEHLIWGLIEDVDVVVAIHQDVLSEPAAKIASRTPVAVTMDDSLARAAELMLERDVTHLAVVGPTGFPVAIVSTLDVVNVLGSGAVRPSH